MIEPITVFDFWQSIRTLGDTVFTWEFLALVIGFTVFMSVVVGFSDERR